MITLDLATDSTACRSRVTAHWDMPEWRHICCPVDLSEESHRALSEGAELARRSGARLTILHVLPPTRLAGGEPIFAPPPIRAEADREPRAADDKLQAWAAEAEVTAGRPVGSIRIAGHALREILGFIEEQSCDLVVLGRHPRAGMRRLLRRWSVGEWVVRRAPCPVLVVPVSAAERASSP
jgi:nucleotide-binding universal stress UspA family protein